MSLGKSILYGQFVARLPKRLAPTALEPCSGSLGDGLNGNKQIVTDPVTTRQILQLNKQHFPFAKF